MLRMKRLKSWLSIALIAMLLSGCVTVASEQKVSIRTQCPALTKYNVAVLQKAAEELDTLPTNSSLAQLLNDYSKLRDICRQIEKIAKAQK